MIQPLEMIPWVLLGSAEIPGDGGELRLYRRDSEFSLRVGQTELMNSRVHGSEDALATLALERLGTKRSSLRVLIGGLGMGFTLAAVLERLGHGGRVVVAELVPEVVAWNRGPLGAVSGMPLRDKRVSVRETDVVRMIAAEKSAYDAILLDVDNGPNGLTARANDRLYSLNGLRSAFEALRPGGVLAVWSSETNAAFTKRLKQTGFNPEFLDVRGHGAGGPRYWIWLARRP